MDLPGRQAEMRARWQKIRPVISKPPATKRVFRAHAIPKAGSPKRPFGTLTLDSVCEIKQIGKLINEMTMVETQTTFATIARATKQFTTNPVIKNVCDEFLRGLGQQ